ncbi:unnamed protein product [Phytophthora lilii]|uniref:Unnamed protein product n=1 Tax=Phytophthora lilii TaxID=2077276 RepID=A0A9W6YEN8_9STRA|nr:unnamed protein product [Phytophthora lilii]
MAAKIEAVNDAIDLFNLIRTEENKEQLNQAKADLRAHRANIKERNEANKFAADLPDGSITEDSAEITSGHREFWGKLFQSTSPDLKHHRTATYRPIELAKLFKDTVKHLTPQQRRQMDAPLMANELYWAIMKSENGKAPGPDGLPIEYYKLAPS